MNVAWSNRKAGPYEGIAAIVLSALLCCLASPAFAGHLDCDNLDPDRTGMVSPTAGCQYSDVSGANDSEAQVNFDMMFGHSDWMFAGRDEFSNSGPGGATGDIGLEFTGDTETGTWSMFSSVWDTYSDVMLVFKNGHDEPDSYVGYLVSDGESNGVYNSPFRTGGGNVKAISHASAYVRDGNGTQPPNGEVPEPTSLMLFGVGLAGMGYSRRRRSAHSA